MTSSAIRDRSTPIIASTNAASAAKSRDAVASIEFSAAAVEAELRGDRVGIESERRTGQRAGTVRRHRRPHVEVDEPLRRRAAAGARAPAGGARAAPAARPAGASCPASSRSGARRPAWRARRRRRAHPSPTRRTASRSHIRNSVATWSLRERPARSRPPSSATDPVDQAALERAVHVLVGFAAGRSSPSATSAAEAVRARRASPSASARRSSRPALCSTRACAWDARTSYGASTQSKWVDLLSAAMASAGPDGEPAAPQRALVGAVRTHALAGPDRASPRSSRTGRGCGRSPWR